MLLRHGKSDWSEQLDDFDRPLKERGKSGSHRMGAWLLEQELRPDLVVSSPARRAIDTARRLVMAMDADAREIVKDRRIYAARVEDLLQVLAELPAGAQRVLLVGHNPGLENLAEYLQEKSVPLPADGKLLPTATLAILQLPDDWSKLAAGCGLLTSLTRASSLPRQFPFPGPKGKERRERPAYYYRQVAVLPYRQIEGRLEILMVMSRKRKHWILPKGISDPGMSLAAMALQEAREEAGVEGEVNEQSLGRYRYKKWGAECSVELFPLRVTRELDESGWEERHRGRQWVNPKQALKRLKQPELRQMVEGFVERLRKEAAVDA